MAMMISKFNTLIRSRLLWGVFLVVIVLSFVVWGMPSCTREDGARRTGVEGVLNGRDITFEEYRDAHAMTILERFIMSGQDMSRREDFAERLRELTWLRIARLEKAREWGLRASDDEVRQVMMDYFVDPSTGTYSRAVYDSFRDAVAQNFGFSSAVIDRCFAEAAILRKLDAIVVGQAQISPAEVSQAYHTRMDTVLADYVRIPTGPVADAVEISDADARAAYDADPQAFTVPERRAVSYVFIADPDPGTVSVDPASVEAFYYDNSDRFEVASTNEAGEVTSKIRDLEEVRAEIEAELRVAGLPEVSEAAANEFWSAAFPGSDGVVPNFAELAASRGLECVEVEAFSASDNPVPSAGPLFVREAFRRELGPNDAIGDPIPVEGGWIVLKLTDLQEPRVPPFEEVAERAAVVAREKAVADAVAARVAGFRAAAGSRGFDAAAAAEGLAVTAAEPFTMAGAAMSDNADLRALSGVVFGVNPGETTDAAPVGDAVLVARVKGIVPASEEDLAANLQAFTRNLYQLRAEEFYALFNKNLLADFTDLRLAPETEDAEEDGEAGTAAEE